MNRTVVDRALDALFLADVCAAGELLLVRHADTADVPEGADASLSRAGRIHAARLAEALADSGVAAVCAAGTAGSLETAEIVAGRLGLGIEVVPDLGPIRLDPAGEGAACEAEGAFAVERAVQRLNCFPRWDSIPGAENSRLFRRRVIQAVEAIAARYPGQTAVIVTHSCAINAYLSMVLDIPRDFFFQPQPASVSCVRIKGDAYSVRYLNAERPPAEAHDRAGSFNRPLTAVNNPLTGLFYG